MLLHNMLSFSMPDMLPAFVFDAGSTVSAALLPLTSEVYLETPDGSLNALPFTVDGITFRAGAPGLYTLLQTRTGEHARFVDFVVRVPKEESDPFSSVLSVPLRLSRDGPDDEAGDPDDGLMDIKYYAAGALLLLLVLEWVVYHREQY